MFCQQCGTKAEQGAKFCSSCGNSFKDQQEELPQQRDHEDIVIEEEEPSDSIEPMTELAVQEIVVSSLEPVKSPPKFNAQNLMKNKRIMLPVAVVLIAVIVFAGFKLFPSSSSNYTLVYAKDNQLLLKNTKMENPYLTTKKIMDGSLFEDSYYTEEDFYTYDMDGVVKKSKDGSRIFYMDNIDDDWTGALYYIESSNLKGATGEQDKAVRIASNVSLNNRSPYTINDQGNQVLYIKDYDYTTGGKLYLHNLKEEVLIDKNVKSLSPLSKNNTMILYTKTSDDGETTDLYIKDIKSNKEKEKIDSNIYTIVKYTPDFEKVYYTKDNQSKDEYNDLNLYVKEMGKDNEKLISDLSLILSSHEDGSFMFTRTNSTEVSLYDLVEDDMLTSDEQLLEPYLSDFETEVEDIDWWGDTYYRTITDYDAYYDALDAYRDKAHRDDLRDELKNETVSSATTALFIYANGEEKKSVEALGNGEFNDVQSQIAIYSKQVELPQKKKLLSTIEEAYDVKSDYWNSFVVSKERYAMINGVETELSNNELYFRDYTISKDHKKLYWIESNEEYDLGMLVSYDVVGDKLENRQEIEDHVYRYVLTGNTIWYYKDVKNGEGDLFTYVNGKKTEISYDVLVGASMIFEDENTVLFLTDYNDNRLLGTLNLSNGKEKVKIADDVHSYYYWDRNNIYYIADYKTRISEGDLWEYHGENKKQHIDDSVNYVVPLKTGIWF